jgi:DNA replication protein DnaC
MSIHLSNSRSTEEAPEASRAGRRSSAFRAEPTRLACCYNRPVVVAEKVCAECGGRGWVLFDDSEGHRAARECACRFQERRSSRFEAANVPERYRDCSFRDFHHLNNPSLKNACRTAEEFADAYPYVETGLLFLGPSGTGKTHLAIAILNEVTRSKGRPGLYADFSDLLMKIQSTFKADATESKEDVLTPFAEVELLILDELGATKPSDFARDMLYALLNTRYNRKRITVATSNYLDHPGKGDREKLEDRIGYRLRSRLHEMCQTILLAGDDYRSQVGSAQFRGLKSR